MRTYYAYFTHFVHKPLFRSSLISLYPFQTLQPFHSYTLILLSHNLRNYFKTPNIIVTHGFSLRSKGVLWEISFGAKSTFRIKTSKWKKSQWEEKNPQKALRSLKILSLYAFCAWRKTVSNYHV
jgi:hypothetical protein